MINSLLVFGDSKVFEKASLIAAYQGKSVEDYVYKLVADSVKNSDLLEILDKMDLVE